MALPPLYFGRYTPFSSKTETEDAQIDAFVAGIDNDLHPSPPSLTHTQVISSALSRPIPVSPPRLSLPPNLPPRPQLPIQPSRLPLSRKPRKSPFSGFSSTLPSSSPRPLPKHFRTPQPALPPLPDPLLPPKTVPIDLKRLQQPLVRAEILRFRKRKRGELLPTSNRNFLGPKDSSLIVSNLSLGTGEEELRRLFGTVAPVIGVVVGPRDLASVAYAWPDGVEKKFEERVLVQGLPVGSHKLEVEGVFMKEGLEVGEVGRVKPGFCSTVVEVGDEEEAMRAVRVVSGKVVRGSRLVVTRIVEGDTISSPPTQKTRLFISPLSSTTTKSSLISLLSPLLGGSNSISNLIISKPPPPQPFFPHFTVSSEDKADSLIRILDGIRDFDLGGKGRVVVQRARRGGGEERRRKRGDDRAEGEERWGKASEEERRESWREIVDEHRACRRNSHIANHEASIVSSSSTSTSSRSSSTTFSISKFTENTSPPHPWRLSRHWLEGELEPGELVEGAEEVYLESPCDDDYYCY